MIIVIVKIYIDFNDRNNIRIKIDVKWGLCE